MGPEALVLVTVMGLIALAGAAGAVVVARRSWHVLTAPAPGGGDGTAGAAFQRPIPRPPAQQYAGWGRERRIAHWVDSLARQARGAVETGAPAEQVFDAALVDQMRRTDPHIELLLPPVLTDLAEREGVEPAQLSAAFARWTGVKVETPPELVAERRQTRLARRP
jgi:hypothetical protein